MKFLICRNHLEVIKIKPRKRPCAGDAIVKEKTRSAYMFLVEIPV
jgi:hypothetical protein